MNNQSIKFSQGNGEVAAGFEILLKKYGYVMAEDDGAAGLNLTARRWNQGRLKITKCKDECNIFYNKKAHFFRGVSLLLQNREKEDFVSEEIVNFDSNGMMLDCSRNCVPTIETIKKFILRLAESGMNRLYLYMEDTLEIEGYPYWGYMRGRLSKAEIQECDIYATSFGVTLVPCIQTLAHLGSVLKQPVFEEYRDIGDILLLEEPKSKELLSALLKTVSECFSGKVVHLGMDEAANLGRGKYLEKHGLKDPAKLMKEHLDWLLGLCTGFGLTPVIWSDMYLKLNFGVDDYYSLSGDELPQGEDNLSRGICLCYWDYYNEGKEFYKKYIHLHQKLGNPLIFAGGAWTWNGVSPGISKAFKTAEDALEACCTSGVKDIFFTAWMDNGAETPLATSLPVLTLYGEYGFSSHPTKEQIEERFQFCFGSKWSSYCLLDAFDNQLYESGEIEKTFDLSKHNRYCENPSKTILYEDNLMGLFVKMYDEAKLQSQYGRLAEEIRKILDARGGLAPKDRDLFAYYLTLARILFQKAGITERIRKAYALRDMQGLRIIAENELEEIASLAEKLRIQRRSLWMREYKPFGYEVIDIRLAGVAVRARSAADRILSFLAGEQTRLLELEEEILPYKTPEILGKELLHGYYMWERIVSSGNVEGI